MGNFVDHVKITCKAGNGGNGSMSFHREKFVLNGGPDGGDGGNGGNVCFYADLNMHTLLDFRFKSKYTAENGVDGAAGNCTGKRGEDLIIKVPVGTVIRETRVVGGKTASADLVVDAYEPHTHVAISSAAEGITVLYHYRLSPEGDGTRLEWTCELEAGGLRKMMLPMVAAIMKKEDGAHLQSLKR